MEEIVAVIHGKVQGVWFRAWTRDIARELGVAGWVRNLPDGSVEALAQAEKGVLDQFIERLHDGPPLARVTEVVVKSGDKETVFDSFDVRR
ncbi:Acylphosphatase [Pseudodesulfovibrio profundus]|uniref:acylphosphatase n=1 Tax=Pseudodesulfovibrio profundus TaxID=57320 RepID=A0A2C8FAJ3_9BACT|nr:acylphosphatase [Pseudodesulfovibrio profundus]SOB59520.1 Acylphosphatase [Pseudodesulfovibrio profundus]|tara:strand:- start:206 stop:478 length:273 start_codon:yes stop_codon:yes gene_type:complete